MSEREVKWGKKTHPGYNTEWKGFEIRIGFRM